MKKNKLLFLYIPICILLFVIILSFCDITLQHIITIFALSFLIVYYILLWLWNYKRVSYIIPHREPIFDRIVRESDELCLIWFSGLNSNLSYEFFGNVKNFQVKLVLLDPKSEFIKELSKIDDQTIENTIEAIKSFTNRVVKLGWNVRWFDGPILNSIIISNPSKINGWAKIEQLLPFSKTMSRPSIFIYKNDIYSENRELFSVVMNGFGNLWNKSRIPLSNEYSSF